MQPITCVTTQIPKPAGITASDYVLRLLQGETITHESVVAVPTTTFADVPSGTYTIFAARLGTNGAVIGTPVTREYTVTDGEMVDVPLSILVGGA